MEGLVKREDGTFEYKRYVFRVQGENDEEIQQNVESVKGKIDDKCKSDSIGELAFCNCSNLTQITIPSSVTSIGELAFCNCSNLTQITLPSTFLQADKQKLGLINDFVEISYEENDQENAVNADVQNEEKLDRKTKFKLFLCGIFGGASIAAVILLIFLPGAQALLIGPLLAMGVPKIAAVIATAAQFVGMALASVGIARDIVKFTDILLGPVRMVASVLKSAAEFVLGILSPILPNRWLAKSYAFLNNAMSWVNGVKDKVEYEVAENDKNKTEGNEKITNIFKKNQEQTTAQKILNVFANIASAILTPITKVAIFVGNLGFNLLLMPIDMYIKPIIPKEWAEKINKRIGWFNGKFQKASDELTNVQMESPVLETKVYSIKNKMIDAKNRAFINRENQGYTIIQTEIK